MPTLENASVAPAPPVPPEAADRFFVTGGALPPDQPSYVERAADHELVEALQAGDFCYVLTARQMGKSSLMSRAFAELRRRGALPVVLDLSGQGINLTPEQWFNGLVLKLGRALRLGAELKEFIRIQEHLGPQLRWMEALQEVVLPRFPEQRIVIFVDEIDQVRSLPFSADEFFAGIRELYNRRSLNASLHRLSFCLLGVATPSDLITDKRVTPFNIGRRVELCDFSKEEALLLAPGLGRVQAAVNETLLHRIYHWTAGQPYLTQRLCRETAAHPEIVDPAGVDRLCADLFLSARARETDPNLTTTRDRLIDERRPQEQTALVLNLYNRLLGGSTIPYDELDTRVATLRLAGAASVDGKGRLQVKNRICARVFNRAWVASHLPDSARRQQRRAFRKGLAVASVVGLAFCAVAGWGFYQRYQNVHERARKAENELKIQKIQQAAAESDSRVKKAELLLLTAKAESEKEKNDLAVKAQRRVLDLIERFARELSSPEGIRPEITKTENGPTARLPAVPNPDTGSSNANATLQIKHLFKTILQAYADNGTGGEAGAGAADDEVISGELRLLELAAKVFSGFGESEEAVNYLQKIVTRCDALVSAQPSSSHVSEWRLKAVRALHHEEEIRRTVQESMPTVLRSPSTYTPPATPALDDATQRLQRARRDYPADPEWALEDATNRDLRGDLERERTHHVADRAEARRKARELYESAQDIRRPLDAAQTPTRFRLEARLQLARSERKIGNLIQDLWGLQTEQDALRAYQRSLEQLKGVLHTPEEEVKQANYRDDQWHRFEIEANNDLALAYHNEGSMYMRLGRRQHDPGQRAQALESWRNQIETLQHLCAIDPHNQNWRAELADAMFNVGGELVREPDNAELFDKNKSRVVQWAQAAVELTGRTNWHYLSLLYEALNKPGGAACASHDPQFLSDPKVVTQLMGELKARESQAAAHPASGKR